MQSLQKSVNQSWNKTWTQHTMHIANHLSAGLFLSKNTHDHRANHSCEKLLWGLSKIADLPSCVKIKEKDTHLHYKLNFIHVTEVSHDKRNCLMKFSVLEERACLPLFFQRGRFTAYKDRAQPVQKSSKNNEDNLPWRLEGFIDSRRQNWLYNNRTPKQT